MLLKNGRVQYYFSNPQKVTIYRPESLFEKRIHSKCWRQEVSFWTYPFKDWIIFKEMPCLTSPFTRHSWKPIFANLINYGWLQWCIHLHWRVIIHNFFKGQHRSLKGKSPKSKEAWSASFYDSNFRICFWIYKRNDSAATNLQSLNHKMEKLIPSTFYQLFEIIKPKWQ